MKQLIVLALATVFSVSANAGYFICEEYTDNKVDSSTRDFQSGLKGDAPRQEAITNIRLNADGYTVSQNVVFDSNLIFKNPYFSQNNRYAENNRGMFFRKSEPDGRPYFIVLTTGKDAKVNELPKDNPLTRLVTLARCTEH